MKKTCVRLVIVALMLLCSAFPLFCDSSQDFALGTGAWNGIYKWENPTKKTNNGKCTEIVFKVVEVLLEDGEFAFEVWDCSNSNNLRRMFPIETMPFNGFKWHTWNEDSTVADNYRANAYKFNTTSYTPSKWRVKSLTRDGLSGVCIVETKAFIFTVNTENHFTLRYNEKENVMELAFTMDGDSIASMGLFYNPAPSDEGKKVFVLTKILNL